MSKKDAEKETTRQQDTAQESVKEAAAQEEPVKTDAAEQSAVETAVQEPEQEAAPPEAESELQAQLEKAAAEFAAQKDLWLRTAAEYDNYRKRTEREKTNIYSSAAADTAEKFLPVADNLERALAQPDCSAQDLRKGVEMVSTQLHEALAKVGLSAVGEVGEPFNPELHNAVSHIEDEKLGENVISAVFQKGYRLGDKIVRHAMVQVAN